MYVNVVPHVNDEGRIDPLAVIWPDGRTFRIDEVLYRGEPGQMQKGAKTSRFRIRFGRRKPICTWSAAKVRRRSAPPTSTAGGSMPSTTSRLSLAARGTGRACGRVAGSPRRTAQEVKQGVAGGRNMD